MTADELREHADMLLSAIPLVPPSHRGSLTAAADYLRACADALDAGPVAWTDGCGSAVTRAEMKGREPHEFTADQDMLAYTLPLYPIAMPATTLRLPEPMTDEEFIEAYGQAHSTVHGLRAIEAEILRRLKEANNAAPTPPGQHSDDVAVDRFAAAMKAKLAQKRAEGRGGWDDPEQCPVERLAELLHKHVSTGDPIDVANFAMMLWCRGGRTTPPVQQDGEALEVLRELVEARDEFTGSRGPQAIRSAGQRIRAAEMAARALLANRGEK